MLSATVRNGLLVYRLCNGALVKICEQPWAKDMSLGVGTKRIPESWLSHRYSWLSKDGVPQPPDFKLSSNIKAVSDLIEWSYDSPAPAEEAADDSLDVPDSIQEELLLPLNNSPLPEADPGSPSEASAAPGQLCRLQSSFGGDKGKGCGAPEPGSAQEDSAIQASLCSE